MKQKTAAIASVVHHSPGLKLGLGRGGNERGRALAEARGADARAASVGAGSVGAAGTDSFAQGSAGDRQQAGEQEGEGRQQRRWH